MSGDDSPCNCTKALVGFVCIAIFCVLLHSVCTYGFRNNVRKQNPKSRWLIYHESWEPVEAVANGPPGQKEILYRRPEGQEVSNNSGKRESFAIIRGGPHGTGDSKLSSLIDRFLNSSDELVRRTTQRMMFHEDDQETYTQEKKEVFMCMKDASSGNAYYTEQELANVMAHELAHAAHKEYDPQHRTREFHDLHQRFLNSITTPDFKPIPPINGYCHNVPKS